VRVEDYGVFVELAPGMDGMVHVSQLADFPVKNVRDVVKLGDELMVMVTNVVLSAREANVHSTLVGVPCPGHSTRIRLFGSISFTATAMETPYISHSHRTSFPASSLPLPRVNQKLEVMAGLTKAS